MSGEADARLAEIIAEMERALDQRGGPDGLMESRPGAPLHGDIRILFAFEPPAAALLIAVLQGLNFAELRTPPSVVSTS